MNGNIAVAICLVGLAHCDQVDIIAGGRKCGTGTLKDPTIVCFMGGANVADSHTLTPEKRIHRATDKQRQSQAASPCPASMRDKTSETLMGQSRGRSASHAASCGRAPSSQRFCGTSNPLFRR